MKTKIGWEEIVQVVISIFIVGVTIYMILMGV